MLNLRMRNGKDMDFDLRVKFQFSFIEFIKRKLCSRLKILNRLRKRLSPPPRLLQLRNKDLTRVAYSVCPRLQGFHNQGT